MHTNRLLFLLLIAGAFRGAAATPAYKDVAPILSKHCAACHDAKEAEGHFILDTHAGLMKGGESGPAILPGKADQSPLLKQIEHKEKPFMPPPKKAAKLSDAEIALIRDWINAGAIGPATTHGLHCRQRINGNGNSGCIAAAIGIKEIYFYGL